MSEKITVRKIKTGTVFRLMAAGLFAGLVPIFADFGVLAYFEFMTLSWGEEPLTGLTPLWAGQFMGLFVALACTVSLGTASAFGFWLYSKISTIDIEYEPTES